MVLYRRAVAYCALNIISASSIVFANKAVFSIYEYKVRGGGSWLLCQDQAPR